MIYQELIKAQENSGDWVAFLRAKRHDGTLPTLDGNAISEAMPQIQETLKKRKLAPVISLCRFLAFIDSARFIRESRRIGIFRASKYQFNAESVGFLVQDLLENADNFGFRSDDRRYLSSIRAFLILGPNVRRLHTDIISTLQKRKLVVIKSLLVCIDRDFRPIVEPRHVRQGDRTLDSDAPSFYGAEDRAEAFSLLMTMFQESIVLTESHFTNLDEVGLRSGFYDKLLVKAAKLKAYMNAEITLDAYPYNAVSTGKGVHIAADNPRFEQSIRLGYMQTDLQLVSRQMYASSVDVSNDHFLKNLAQQFHAILDTRFVKRVFKPVDRYVMALPFNEELKDLLSSNKLFREEAVYLAGLKADSYCDPEWILTATVYSCVTVLDLIKAHRFFSFLADVFFTTLEAHPPESDQEGIDMRSRLPVFRLSQVSKILEGILGVPVATEVLNLFTYVPARGGYFDIQYQPFIRAGDWVILPLSVLGASNIVRNVLYNKHTRLLPPGGRDPMQDSLEQSLRARGFLVKAGVKGKLDGRKFEIDLLGYAGNHLFIWECKNAFHPCGPQEMRTSYGHVLKAASQLSRVRELLSSTNFQAKLFKDLGWPVSCISNISTCIVTANRLFTGYAIDGHPIRQAFEMSNLLDRGCINLNGEKRRVWKGVEFEIEDLLAHIRGETIMRDFYDCMIEQIYSMRLGSGTLSMTTYALDIQRLAHIVLERYPLCEECQRQG